MCFSATASIGAGLVLTVVGVASIKKVTKPQECLFASIPLLFAVQQFAEGILWSALPSGDDTQLVKMSTAVFIIIAQIIWPVWVPLSILKTETKKTARKILTILIGLGFVVSLYLAWCFIKFGVKAEIDGYHIAYRQTYPDIYIGLGEYSYALATIFPPFLSRFKRMWFLGLAILVSYLFTKIMYDNYLISVWCFFAALISSTVYFVLSEINKNSFTSDADMTKD